MAHTNRYDPDEGGRPRRGRGRRVGKRTGLSRSDFQAAVRAVQDRLGVPFEVAVEIVRRRTER